MWRNWIMASFFLKKIFINKIFFSVHCDICKTLNGLKNFVQFYKKNEPAKCSIEGFASGNYEDLSLRVCLPSKSDLLPFLDSVFL